MKKQTYAEATKNSPPNKLVRQALKFSKSRNKALDVGAGSLRDSLFLESEGFKEITAIDKEVQEIKKGNIKFIHENIEDFDLPYGEYDMVVAINSLPFLNNKDFIKIFPEIVDSIKSNGILCFTLFGEKDDWNSGKGKEKMNFHTKSDVMNMLNGFSDIKIFIEEEREGKTVNGKEKHWHVFRVVAVK